MNGYFLKILDSDDEETNDSSFESKQSGETAEQKLNRFEIHTDSDLLVWERIETKEDKITIEQGKK